MSFIFRGRLEGGLCSECCEFLSGVSVRLYRHAPGANITALAVASANDTLALLTDDQVQAKAGLLIAEATTDANGAFAFELGDAQAYRGDAFEIDVYCGTVPHRKAGARATAPKQFSITTLQPAWKPAGDAGFVAIWQYCVPSRFWCWLRGLFDAWVICGRLTACEDGTPIPGAVVNAIDVDWIQDDPLGAGTTDGAGRFRIDYTSADFRVTPFSPFINLESVGGPDIYFKVTLGADTIIDEPPSTGRKPGRENVGPCFCVALCTDKVHTRPEDVPHWQQVWGFDVHPDAGQPGSDFSAEGYAGGANASFVFGDGNAFHGVQLNGNCPLTNVAAPSNSLEYRFVIGEYTWAGPLQDDPNTMPGVAPASLAPVMHLRPTTVGYVSYVDAHGVFSWADVVIDDGDVQPDGWIRVNGKAVTVQMHDGTTAIVNVNPSNFLRTNALMMMNSSVITGVHAPKMPLNLPQTQAGRSLTDAEKEPIRRYRLQFEVRDASTLATIWTDTLSSLVLDNSDVIAALDLEELFLDLCNPLGGAATAHILYTVDHPHMSAFNVEISNNGGIVHPAPPLPNGNFLPAANVFFRGGAGGPHNATNTGGFAVDISADPACAYRVRLSWATRQYLVSGDFVDVLYCKS
jgi:hypothetical protein